ncbi:DUF6382 domain-containing protein [Paenibacillus silvisoli]|uniref:DUF6382 domain-containing protein n=1 Tax=Paenibacillus silvisoli TaxID=3110539 RepID=UPI00280394B3|nr:DUF6382 domain-containing protein [Paenibacillus silvisoli]
MLNGLKVDFALKRGLEMIVDLESGITRERLDPIEIQMLQNQRIPKLLPLEWEDIDGAITLRYPISGKRMLMNGLQTQQLTMAEFYALLLAVVELLDDCKHYMLREECFLLHEQYMFVGENWEQPELAYVPLRDMKLVSSAGEAVLAMAIRWVGSIAEPDGNGMQQVFQHLRGEYVAWGKLRRTLLALLGDEYRASGANDLAETMTPASVAPSARRGPVAVPAFSGSTKAAETKRPAFSPAEAAPPLLSRAIPSGDEFQPLPLTELPDHSAESSPRRVWVIGAASLLIIALIWRFLYMSAPTQTNLLLCAGLTLMTAAAALIVNRRLQRSRGHEERSVWSERQPWQGEEDGFIPNSIPLRTGNRRLSAAEGQLGEAGQYHEATAEPVNEPYSPFGARPEGGSGNASRLQSNSFEQAANDATVLLGQDARDQSETDGSIPWLERMMDGHEAEKVKLEPSKFLIGRSSEGVNFVDKASGVSRAHLELTASHESWSVKDMGSRNGTTLNGTAMIPYKAYSLTDSDVLQLAGEQGPKYMFRAGGANMTKPSKPVLRTG